jgi:hypothetical protein
MITHDVRGFLYKMWRGAEIVNVDKNYLYLAVVWHMVMFLPLWALEELF